MAVETFLELEVQNLASSLKVSFKISYLLIYKHTSVNQEQLNLRSMHWSPFSWHHCGRVVYTSDKEATELRAPGSFPLWVEATLL